MKWLTLPVIGLCCFSMAAVGAQKTIGDSKVVSAHNNNNSAINGQALQSLLAPIITFQANFSQTVKSEQGRVLQRLSGKVWLKKPAQFRWEVIGQEPRLIVADGKTVWDFDQDLEQVTIQKLNAAQIRAPIFFLTGDVKTIDRDFKISSLSVDKLTETNLTISVETSTASDKICLSASDTCFQMVPKREEGSFQWIRIGFKNKALKEMELLDQLGQYSHFVFTDLKLNKNISGSLFTFKPPKGVDVLHND